MIVFRYTKSLVDPLEGNGTSVTNILHTLYQHRNVPITMNSKLITLIFS